MMGDMWHSMRQQQLGDETEATYLDKVLEEARRKSQIRSTQRITPGSLWSQ